MHIDDCAHQSTNNIAVYNASHDSHTNRATDSKPLEHAHKPPDTRPVHGTTDYHADCISDSPPLYDERRGIGARL